MMCPEARGLVKRNRHACVGAELGALGKGPCEVTKVRLSARGFLISAALVALGATSLAPAQAASPVLPDLQMATLSGFTISSDPSLPGHKLLRFNTIIVNTGAAGGAFEVLGSRGSAADTTMTVSQVIYNSDGSTTTVPVPGASMIYDDGDGHHHWHLRDLERYSLQTPSGQTLSAPKIGYCFFDNDQFNLSLPGAPQSPVYTNCGDTDSLAVRTGLSVGWGDEYPSSVFDQWIDITGQRNGHYHLTATADPFAYFDESTEANNSTWVDLSIHGRNVKVLRYGPSA
jgi:hypothetical protein